MGRVILNCTLFIISCDSNSKNSYSRSSFDSFSDGKYCAEIQYYYSKTGTQSNYTLLVEVEEGKLIKIFWSNGGWLDDTHFIPPEIEGGSAEFTSYEGVHYTIKITGESDDCSTSDNSKNEDELIQEGEDNIKLIRHKQREENELEEEEKKKRELEEEEKKKLQEDNNENDNED